MRIIALFFAIAPLLHACASGPSYRTACDVARAAVHVADQAVSTLCSGGETTQPVTPE